MIGVLIFATAAIIIGFVLFSNKGEGYHLLTSAKTLFIQDLAKTPKGAEIVYTKAIEEDRARYRLASDTYAELSGQLMDVRSKHDTAELAVKSIEGKMEKLAKAHDEDGLRILARERSGLLVEMNSWREQGERLAPLVVEAKNIMEATGYDMIQLQRDYASKPRILSGTNP